jgi:hypothetical protein
MKWSKSKKALKNLLDDSVKDRVQFHMTRYGPGISYFMARAWITWDKKELVNMSNVEWENEISVLTRQITEINSCTNFKDPQQREGYDLAYEEARRLIQKKGLLSRYQFEQAIEEYLELPIEKAMDSDNPIIKALSMFDRRLGKRRLVEISLSKEEHPLVKLFYHLRCEGEGLPEVKG